MKIFDFSSPFDVLDNTKNYLKTTGNYLLNKFRGFLPKNCENLYNQILSDSDEIFYNHPRAWHFTFTTQNLITTFLSDHDPSPEIITHLDMDCVYPERIIELHLFNAVELAFLKAETKNSSLEFSFDFQLPSQMYLPKIGNCILHNLGNKSSKVSFDPSKGVSINDQMLNELVNSKEWVNLPDNFSISFDGITINIPIDDPVLNNPYYANGPILRNRSYLENWVENYVIKALELCRNLFPKNYIDILSLSTHYFFIHNSTNRFSSASSEKIPGIIYLPCINNVDHLAECIIHENLHQLLFRIEKVMDIYEGGHTVETYWSPWRDDSRPLRMIMHGAYVFAGVAEYWRGLVDLEKKPEDYFQLYLRIQQVKEGMKVLENHAHYTPAGQELHQHILNCVNNISLSDVPNSIKEDADERLIYHRKKIDNENYVGF